MELINVLSSQYFELGYHNSIPDESTLQHRSEAEYKFPNICNEFDNSSDNSDSIDFDYIEPRKENISFTINDDKVTYTELVTVKTSSLLERIRSGKSQVINNPRDNVQECKPSSSPNKATEHLICDERLTPTTDSIDVNVKVSNNHTIAIDPYKFDLDAGTYIESQDEEELIKDKNNDFDLEISNSIPEFMDDFDKNSLLLQQSNRSMSPVLEYIQSKTEQPKRKCINKPKLSYNHNQIPKPNNFSHVYPKLHHIGDEQLVKRRHHNFVQPMPKSQEHLPHFSKKVMLPVYRFVYVPNSSTLHNKPKPLPPIQNMCYPVQKENIPIIIPNNVFNPFPYFPKPILSHYKAFTNSYVPQTSPMYYSNRNTAPHVSTLHTQNFHSTATTVNRFVPKSTFAGTPSPYLQDESCRKVFNPVLMRNDINTNTKLHKSLANKRKYSLQNIPSRDNVKFSNTANLDTDSEIFFIPIPPKNSNVSIDANDNYVDAKLHQKAKHKKLPAITSSSKENCCSTKSRKVVKKMAPSYLSHGKNKGMIGLVDQDCLTKFQTTQFVPKVHNFETERRKLCNICDISEEIQSCIHIERKRIMKPNPESKHGMSMRKRSIDEIVDDSQMQNKRSKQTACDQPVVGQMKSAALPQSLPSTKKEKIIPINDLQTLDQSIPFLKPTTLASPKLAENENSPLNYQENSLIPPSFGNIHEVLKSAIKEKLLPTKPSRILKVFECIDDDSNDDSEQTVSTLAKYDLDEEHYYSSNDENLPLSTLKKHLKIVKIKRKQMILTENIYNFQQDIQKIDLNEVMAIVVV